MSKSKKTTSINKKYSGYKYGIGIEHEMYMFHFPETTNKNDMEYKDPIKNIILAPSEAYQVLIWLFAENIPYSVGCVFTAV